MSNLTFKQFITEIQGSNAPASLPVRPKGGNTHPNNSTFTRSNLDLDKMLQTINQNCTGWVNWARSKKTIPIFRGDNNSRSVMSLGDSNNFVRQAANTYNWYLQWIDASPAWADYPKRSKSFICTRDVAYTEGYGELNLVIPFDTAHIGACPKYDMWFSFKDISSISRISSIGYLQDHILNLLSDLQIKVTSKDVSQTRQMFEKVTRLELEQLIEPSIHTLDMLYKKGKINVNTKDLINIKSEYSLHVNKDEISKFTDEYPELLEVVGSKFEEFKFRYKLVQLMSGERLSSLADVYDYIFDGAVKDFRQFTGADLNRALDKVPTSAELWVQGKCIFVNLASLSRLKLRDEDTTNKIVDAFKTNYSIDLARYIDANV